MALTKVARDPERSRLIEQYLPLASDAARRFAHRGAEREDLMQVAALAVVRAVDRRDPRRSELLPAYVNRSVDGELRRPRAALSDDSPTRRTAQVPLRLAEEEWGADETGVEEMTLERALIARAARVLDARQRRIVLLCFFLDQTQEEVASELGISQAHVSRLLTDALERMRHHLERDEPLNPAEMRARVEWHGLESRPTRGG
jgi:RNA polymerase sigma-B factor